MKQFIRVAANNRSANNRTLCYGVGINDSPYKVKNKSSDSLEMCPIYKSWTRMLERCYSERKLESRPSYSFASVCDDWLFFSRFSEWYDENYIEGYHLDKDIKIKGNKLYSPDTCLFVPHQVNSKILDSKKSRGKYPIGVTTSKGKSGFLARCHVEGKYVHLGTYKTPELANEAYKEAKNGELIRLMHKYPEFSCYISNHLY